MTGTGGSDIVAEMQWFDPQAFREAVLDLSDLAAPLATIDTGNPPAQEGS
jgi:hypothetical protein